MADNRTHHGSGGDVLSGDLIAQRGFATIFRGFDPTEVREFLNRVAAEVRELREHLEQAEIARRSAEERALHPKLDEETLLAAVGEETASILRMARAASTDIRAKAEEQATTVLREAQAQADALRAEAESVLARRTAEAEAAADSLRAHAASDVERILTLARQEAESVRQQAEQDRRLTIEAAQSIREKILTDLSRRRRVANVQVEQLRAGRERLLDAYLVVRRTLDEVTDELQRADAEARAAADAVGRRAAEDPGDMLVDLTTGAVATPAADPGARRQAGDPVTAPVPVMPANPGQSGPGGQVPAERGPGAREPAEPSPAAPANAAAGLGEQEQPGGAVGQSAEPAADPEMSGDPAATHASTEAIADPSPATVSSPEPGAAPSPAGAGGEVLDAPAAGAAEPVRVVSGGSVVTSPRTGRSHSAGRRSGPSGSARSPLAKPTPATVAGDAPQDPVGPEAVDDNVEGLFARIRADRAGAVARARKVLGREPNEAVSTSPTPATAPAAPGPVPAAPALASFAPAPASTAPTTVPASTAPTTVPASTAPAPVPAAPAPSAPAAGASVPDADEALLQLRDETSADVEVALARRLKRVLQDEQNDLLDRLRGVKGHPKARSLLPSQADQRERVASAAQPFLAQAAAAGARFGSQLVGLDSDAVLGAGAPAAQAMAAALAAAVADPLRRRLEQAFTDSAGDDQPVLVEALGAAYREWKTQRIEALAGDHVAAAFSRGAFEAVPDATPLRWLVEDVDGPCPDCDDNALAGSLAKGEEYPTGQSYPPAHPGCRCLLVADGSAR
jgi:DivIVA domain-containing protein